ncbi:MAG: YdcF family protein [Gammaproteobacteria bacterium]|jgi:uncharacterized SAM-binding protein YcdF (DUF218 family)
MSPVQYGIIKSLILPPGVFLVAFIVCLFIYFINKRAFIYSSSVLIFFFYLFSTPFFSQNLAAIIEVYNAIDIESLDKNKSSVIVILGCNRYSNAPEFSGSDTVSACNLVRLRYGAFLQKKTGLPIIVSGGSVYQESISEAEMMKDVLVDEFNADILFAEGKSRNTMENAKEVSNLISANNFEQVILVTHASHMLRAEYSFNYYGEPIIPAPTYFYSTKDDKPFFFMLLPNIKAFNVTSIILYEIIGYAWIKTNI